MSPSAALTYEIRGAGPGLLALHGTGSTGAGTLRGMFDPLAARFTVVAPDLPGSGATPPPDEPLELDALVDRIAATADAAGLERFALLGISLGGPIAVAVAARLPQRVAALATVAGFAVAHTTLQFRFAVFAALLEHDPDALARFLLTVGLSAEVLDGLEPAAAEQVVAGLAASRQPGTAEQLAFAGQLDVRDRLADVRAPTLVVRPTADLFVTPTHSDELAAGIPGAQLHDIDAGHGAMSSHADELSALVADFFAERVAA